MSKQLQTFSGVETMGSLYPTPRKAAVADLYEFVTAGGNNSVADAIKIVEEGQDRILSEMAANGWVCHELTVEDWDAVAADVLSALGRRLGDEENEG